MSLSHSSAVVRWVALASLTVSAFGQASLAPPSPAAEDAANRIIRMQQAWGPASSTPHTSLSIKEISREGEVITFRLYATGLPKQGTYSLMSWPVTQQRATEVLHGVTLDESGLAICAGTAGACGTPDKPNDPINIKLTPLPGEPARLGLISADQSAKVFAKIVPRPVRGEDKGCRVEAVLLTPGAALVEIDGSGFAANAALVMESDSEGERHSGKGQADARGRFVSAVTPYRQGIAHGTAVVSLKAAGCSPSVSFPWGRRN